MIPFQDTSELNKTPSSILRKWKLRIDSKTGIHRHCFESEFELIDNGEN